MTHIIQIRGDYSYGCMAAVGWSPVLRKIHQPTIRLDWRSSGM